MGIRTKKDACCCCEVCGIAFAVSEDSSQAQYVVSGSNPKRMLSIVRAKAAYDHAGLAPLSRTHLKRPIMAVEERHAKKKNVLGGVQT